MGLVEAQLKRSSRMELEKIVIDFDKMTVTINRTKGKFNIKRYEDGCWNFQRMDKSYHKLSEDASNVIEKAHKQWIVDKIILGV
jgi:hypothetical protein